MCVRPWCDGHCRNRATVVIVWMEELCIKLCGHGRVREHIAGVYLRDVYQILPD